MIAPLAAWSKLDGAGMCVECGGRKFVSPSFHLELFEECLGPAPGGDPFKGTQGVVVDDALRVGTGDELVVEVGVGDGVLEGWE